MFDLTDRKQEVVMSTFSDWVMPEIADLTEIYTIASKPLKPLFVGVEDLVVLIEHLNKANTYRPFRLHV